MHKLLLQVVSVTFYQPHIFALIMPSPVEFFRPPLVKSTFDDKLRMCRFATVRMKKFGCISMRTSSQAFDAYFGVNDTMRAFKLDADKYQLKLEAPLYHGQQSIYVGWETLEKNFIQLPDETSFSMQGRSADTGFLQPGALVRMTEEGQFVYVGTKQWSPVYAEGSVLQVVARDKDFADVILQPQAGGPRLQIHLTNARFFKPVTEKSPEDLPTNDGNGEAEAMLPSDVQELQALIQEQARLLDHTEKKYRDLLTKYQTSLDVRVAKATGAGEPLPSSTLDELLEFAIDPFLAEPPKASDIGVLENGQIVSLSKWHEYLSNLPQGTTPICPLTRDEITNKTPIVCHALRNVMEALQRMRKEQQETSAAVDVYGAPSDAKRRRV